MTEGPQLLPPATAVAKSWELDGRISLHNGRNVCHTVWNSYLYDFSQVFYAAKLQSSLAMHFSTEGPTEGFPCTTEGTEGFSTEGPTEGRTKN